LSERVKEQARRFAAAPPEARLLAQLAAIRKVTREEFDELSDRDLFWEHHVEHEASVLADARNFAHDTNERAMKVRHCCSHAKHGTF
jgi:hypothetical protein